MVEYGTGLKAGMRGDGTRPMHKEMRSIGFFCGAVERNGWSFEGGITIYNFSESQ